MAKNPIKGDSYKSLIYGFKVAFNIISLFVPEVCQATYQVYKDEELKCPSTPQECREKAVHFCQRWSFHHAVGALDQKHVTICCPRQSGSK